MKKTTLNSAVKATLVKLNKFFLTAQDAQTAQNYKSIVKIWPLNHLSVYLEKLLYRDRTFSLVLKMNWR